MQSFNKIYLDRFDQLRRLQQRLFVDIIEPQILILFDDVFGFSSVVFDDMFDVFAFAGDILAAFGFVGSGSVSVDESRRGSKLESVHFCLNTC
jgi:hypothetical protein